MWPILVVDLEATCANDGSIGPEEMEIIEIGACWVNEQCRIFDTFQSFVRPSRHAVLTDFCTALTGIAQEQVDAAPALLCVAEDLRVFVERHRGPSSSWGSWGTYDRKQLQRECGGLSVEPLLGLPHQNLKRFFAKRQRIGKEVGMAMASRMTGIQLEGQHHRALDDACNIAKLLPWIFGVNSLG
ncbi:3'-5' exonuclease [Ralstonia sp. SM1864_UCD524_TZ4]|uniref:Exonuclease n=1 Tax=Ralstonia solanacearum TaxID=305 RepID=A0A0S4VSN1_RALSL|nr:3'-5' exonuclease [Ralstonia pseudosolanacearum]CUV26553.1 Exonuclease [Ralstonia solanacearum]CUV37564.1 Exonuclease [Ralstonia solanacearum]CUV42111.1 Exonuclease [Ralstonia solanacearum]CUV64152.1 Exonuclease [Ralstonia solanacearum]